MGAHALCMQQLELLPALLYLGNTKEQDEPGFNLKVSGVLRWTVAGRRRMAQPHQ